MKVLIKSLRVVGCGPLRDVDLDFTDASNKKPRPITLLAGANGSGKTTVLELIAALADMAMSASLHLHLSQMERRMINIAMFDRTSYAQMNLLVDGHDLAIAVGNSIDVDSLPENAIYSTNKDFSRHTKPIARGRIATGLAAALEENLRNAKVDYIHSNSDGSQVDNVLPSFIYLPHLRTIPQVSGNKLEDENAVYRWVHRIDLSKDYHGSLNSYLVWLDYAVPEAFEAVRRTIQTLYPTRNDITIDRKRMMALIVTTDGAKHGLDLLSSGEQNMLLILLEIRRRLIHGSVVLIDEIENSLHAAFQHRLGQALMKMQQEIDFQLIATSHSETFLEIFGAENTLILPVRSQHDRRDTTAAA